MTILSFKQKSKKARAICQTIKTAGNKKLEVSGNNGDVNIEFVAK